MAQALSIISFLLSISVPIVAFAARHWIVERISRGVQHQFDRQIEQLRTDLRKAEEEHKSELRSKEADIAALRSVVLTGSANRQALLDKRRIEAVEKVWAAVHDLGAALKGLSATMAILNYKAVAKEASDPRMQQYLAVIGSTAPGDFAKLKDVARDEQPFLTEPAWAYFNAYKSILHMNHARYMVLKNVVDQSDRDPERYFSTDALKNILKAALPHQTKFIDDNDAGAFHYLLDELELLLLIELRKILDGQASDDQMMARAKAISEAVKQADDEAQLDHAKEIVPQAVQQTVQR
jgi:hypothetical protein